MLNFEWDLKFYFLHMNPMRLEPLKHPETINVNVKILSKRIENESYGECHFYFKNLTLPFNITDFIVIGTILVNIFLRTSVSSLHTCTLGMFLLTRSS